MPISASKLEADRQSLKAWPLWTGKRNTRKISRGEIRRSESQKLYTIGDRDSTPLRLYKMVHILVPRKKRAVIMGNIKKPASTKSTVTRLIRLFNVPERTVKRDWQTIERQMETPLPTDYKELIDRMGGGYLEKYMYILEPDCRNRHYDLMDMTDKLTDVNDFFFEIEGKPPELQSQGSFLIPWGTTDNGEYLFWRCLPDQNPDKWTVMINQGRDGTWEYHDMNFADFLYASLRKEVQSEILSDYYFPLSRHVFRRF